MKRGTPENPKFVGLCVRLGLDEWEGIGLLEAVWMFTARFARRGDIGKWTDEQIAGGIKWRRMPAVDLIAALTAEHWLDPDPMMRFLVHDWPDHCDDTIHMQIARAAETFADGTIPKMNRLSKEERSEIFKRFRAHGIRMTSARRGVVRSGPVRSGLALPGQIKESRSRVKRDELQTWLDSEFGPRYPKHRQVQQRSALAEVRKLKPSPELRCLILDRLARWVSSHQWQDDNGKWVPGMGKFFSDGWWQREPEAPGESQKLKLLRLASGRVIEVKPGVRVEYTDVPGAIDGMELPNGKLSVRQGARWVKGG